MASPGSRLDVFLLKAEPIGFAIDKLDMVERRRGVRMIPWWLSTQKDKVAITKISLEGKKKKSGFEKKKKIRSSFVYLLSLRCP